MTMLRSIREKKGLTLGQLAARASIPSRVLTEYEEGRQPIPLPHAKLLAKALWVQIEDLLPAAGTAPLPPTQLPCHRPRLWLMPRGRNRKPRRRKVRVLHPRHLR